MLSFKEYCKHLNETKKIFCENIENKIKPEISTTGMSPENLIKAKQIAKQIGEAFQAVLDKYNCAVYSPNGEDGTLSIQIKDGNRDAGINQGNLGDDSRWAENGFIVYDPDIESADELCHDLNAAVVNGMKKLKKLGYSYTGIDYDIENGSHSNYEDLCVWAATEESYSEYDYPECYDILYSWSQDWGDFEPEFTGNM